MILAEGFAALLTPVSMYEETALVRSVPPYWDIFQPNLIAFIDMYFSTAFRTSHRLCLALALKEQDGFICSRADS